MPPQLNGENFRITVLEERGFLDVIEDSSGDVSFSGYLIDMLEAIARPDRANFTYTLLTPSGYGSLCSPRLIEEEGSTATEDEYSAAYRTQYNCGASDVNDLPLSNRSTDMYLGMYYVTPSRQLMNQFTIPFLPPYSGTLTMFGVATGIPNFESLVAQQILGLQPPACAPGGTALIKVVEESFPGIQIKATFGDENDITESFRDGSCEIYITDGPLASSFVLRRSLEEECSFNNRVSWLVNMSIIFEANRFCSAHWHCW